MAATLAPGEVDIGIVHVTSEHVLVFWERMQALAAQPFAARVGTLCVALLDRLPSYLAQRHAEKHLAAPRCCDGKCTRPVTQAAYRVIAQDEDERRLVVTTALACAEGPCLQEARFAVHVVSTRTNAELRHHEIDECGKCRAFSNTAPRYKKCGRCRLVAYCSEQCAREHWHAAHRAVCRPLAERESAPVSDA